MIKSAQSPSHLKIPDYNKLILDDMVNRIREIDYFRQSIYCNLDIPETLLFYTNRYVLQLLDFISVSNNTVIADIGAGFGWLAMAFAFTTDALIVAVDIDEARLNAAKKIAEILGVNHRIKWRVAGLGDLPFANQEIDVVYCIEVLEHIQKSDKAVKDLTRISRNLLILTTPNLWFPVIAHDTQLPFCHWLPIPIRKIYAKLFRREDRENNNLFWSPLSLGRYLKEYKTVSKWLHYSSYKKFKDTFPFYLPYGSGSYIKRLGLSKKIYYEMVSKLGSFSHWFLPSLSYVLKRKSGSKS